jgi:diketogulonate reductase-like aldo/keto reductase
MEYHPYVLAQLDLLRPLQDKHNILFQAYGPLVPLIRHPDGGPIKPILEKIAKRLTAETGQEIDATTTLLLWDLSTGVPIVTTSGNEERIKRLAGLNTLPDLSAEEVEEINQAGRSIHFRYFAVSSRLYALSASSVR